MMTKWDDPASRNSTICRALGTGPGNVNMICAGGCDEQFCRVPALSVSGSRMESDVQSTCGGNSWCMPTNDSNNI